MALDVSISVNLGYSLFHLEESVGMNQLQMFGLDHMKVLNAVSGDMIIHWDIKASS